MKVQVVVFLGGKQGKAVKERFLLRSNSWIAKRPKLSYHFEMFCIFSGIVRKH